MKKLFNFLLMLLVYFSLISCTNARSSKAVDLTLKIRNILVIGKTSLFEVEEFLGKPSVKTERRNMVGIAYLDGNFYLKNSEKNKKLLKKYIPPYYLENEKNFDKTLLMLKFYYDQTKNDNILNDLFFY